MVAYGFLASNLFRLRCTETPWAANFIGWTWLTTLAYFMPTFIRVDVGTYLGVTATSVESLELFDQFDHGSILPMSGLRLTAHVRSCSLLESPPDLQSLHSPIVDSHATTVCMQRKSWNVSTLW